MIPLRDTVPSKNYPVANYTLIGINIAVFLFQLSLGSHADQFIYTYGLVPARYSNPSLGSQFTFIQQFLALFTFMFLHGGFWHILGNMWFLYIFGDNVEDRLGSLHYLIFYLLSGLVSGLFHLMLNFHSAIPTIGASGAIAGVMGAYFILYPRARILTLIPIIIIPWIIEIPAYFFLGIWLFFQIISVSAGHASVSGIAWWAHIGGFIFGMAFIKAFKILPEPAVTDSLKKVSLKKKKSERLQVLRPTSKANDFHLYDVIHITPYEAVSGAKKLVNIPWGFYNRLYNINIPPGTKEGTILRLRGLGKPMPDLKRGDLFLKVMIRHPW